MAKHKHYDLIVWWASDPENNIVEFFHAGNFWEPTVSNLPFWLETEEYRKKPAIVKRWKWAYAIADGGHEYEYISNKYYTEEEATEHFSVIKCTWKEKIDATEKEFTE